LVVYCVGSGSLAAMAVFESHYKPDMQVLSVFILLVFVMY